MQQTLDSAPVEGFPKVTGQLYDTGHKPKLFQEH